MPLNEKESRKRPGYSGILRTHKKTIFLAGYLTEDFSAYATQKKEDEDILRSSCDVIFTVQ